MAKIPKPYKSYSYAIIYRTQSSEDSILLDDKENSMTPFNILKPSIRYWYADPLIVPMKEIEYSSKSNAQRVYMEVYDRLKRKGFIGVSEFDSTGRLSRPKRVIEEQFHMSFPFTFYYRDELYMIPETNNSGELRIYKEIGKDLWRLYYSFSVSENLVDICLLGIDFPNSIVLLVGEKSRTERGKIKSSIYIIRNFCELESICLEKICDISGYSFDQRNAGRIIEYNEKKYRLKQHSESGKYGIGIYIDEIVDYISILDNDDKESVDYKSKVSDEKTRKELTVENIGYIITASKDCLLPRNAELIGIHTYDMTYSVDRKNTYEVLDFAWRQYNILDNISMYLNWIRAGIEKHFKLSR